TLHEGRRDRVVAAPLPSGVRVRDGPPAPPREADSGQAPYATSACTDNAGSLVDGFNDTRVPDASRITKGSPSPIPTSGRTASCQWNSRGPCAETHHRSERSPFASHE